MGEARTTFHTDPDRAPSAGANKPISGLTPEGVAFRHWRNWRCFGDFRWHPTRALCQPTPEVLTVLEGALATPRTFWPDRTYSGALFDSDGNLVEESVRPPGETRLNYSPRGGPLPAPEVEEPDVALYLGGLMRHFGHFLLEVLPRLWVFRSRPPRRIYFHAWTRADLGVPRFMSDAFEALRDDGCEVRLIERPTRFARLLAPSPTFCIGERSSPECHAWVQEFAARLAPRLDPGDPARIYVTRRGLKRRQRKITHEEALEALFAARGFAIVRPETLPLAEQVRMMRSCRVLAGGEGSALHQAMFMPAGGAVVGLDFRYNRNQMAVEAMGGRRAVHFRCLRERRGGGKLGDEDRLDLDPDFIPLIERELDLLLPEFT